MNKWKKSICLVIFLLFVPLFRVYGAELTQEPGIKKVLLVYDDLNEATDAQERMNSVQNILLSLGAQVTIKPIDEYTTNELDAYDGLIEVMNAPDLSIQNKAYLNDRSHYPKLKFHMGRNLPIEWQNELSIQLRYIVDEGVAIDSDFFQAGEHIIHEIKTEAVSDSGDGETFATLNFENHFGQYPYAVFKNQVMYVPFYLPSGLSFLTMQRLLATWLGMPDLPIEKPILVIKDVTPVSDLSLLTELTDQLRQAGISFAISSTGLWHNLNQEAATNYLNSLNHAASEGAGIFMQTPYINEIKASPNQMLKTDMEMALDFFIEHHVYPIGMSTPSYWNRDTVFQQDALSFSDTVLLMPDAEQPVFHDKTDTTQTFKTTYVGISHDAFGGVEWRTFDKKGFLAKTALILPMPTTQEELQTVLEDVLDTPSLFDNVMYHDHQLMTTNHELKVTNQQVYVDGGRQWIEATIPHEEEQKSEAPYQSLEGFFAIQNKVLTIIIIATLGVLTLFLVSGYFLYKKKYRR